LVSDQQTFYKKEALFSYLQYIVEKFNAYATIVRAIFWSTNSAALSWHCHGIEEKG